MFFSTSEHSVSRQGLKEGLSTLALGNFSDHLLKFSCISWAQQGPIYLANSTIWLWSPAQHFLQQLSQSTSSSNLLMAGELPLQTHLLLLLALAENSKRTLVKAASGRHFMESQNHLDWKRSLSAAINPVLPSWPLKPTEGISDPQWWSLQSLGTLARQRVNSGLWISGKQTSSSWMSRVKRRPSGRRSRAELADL